MSVWTCPCDECNGVLDPTDYYDDEFEPMDYGILSWDCTLPETLPPGMPAGELWPGVPVPPQPF